MEYDFKKIEKKWQKKWEQEKVFEVEVEKRKKKFFMIFAYPGISGYLHVGHMRGYSYTDIITRYKRMNGYNVLFPVGTHATGNQTISFANKVKNNDWNWINYLQKNGCSKKIIKSLITPEKVVEYFNNVYLNDYWKKFGFFVDWRRFTCTIFPDYTRFIKWQFKKLKDNGLIIQKPYFATFCINCGPVAVDPSETDISKGGNAEKNELTLLKFNFEDGFIIASTLRPETIYGQTNMWVKPDADYIQVINNGEKWWVSKEAAEKLAYQKKNFEITNKIKKGKNFVGKFCKAPGIDKEIIILPAEFCNPNIATGFVTSVPSDAPYDYITLEELKKDKKTLKKFNLSINIIKDLKLIPIIKSKNYGDFPAKEAIEKYDIKDQNEKEKLEKATQEIYKIGFHTGIMLENCGDYSGMKVIDAKEKVKEDLLKQNKADIMYDLSEEVICRCGSKVIIKKIENQWFIKYSDEKLTQESKNHVQKMNILPKQYYNNLPEILDWFQDRACARLGNWLGTKLPFDEKWIIEPISDSTLYPIYYLVSLYYNQKKIKLKEMNEEFFDYVFLGKGKPKNNIWKKIKEDVDYWYPLDMNLGGKEHQTVHFPVFIMNHIGILPKEKWPKGIFINYWVLGKGSKISKSKGGAQPIPEVIKKYGADSMRLYYSHIANPNVDIIWEENKVLNYKQNLEKIFNLIIKSLKHKKSNKKSIDDWLISGLNKEIQLITRAFENFNLRIASDLIYFTLSNKLEKYLKKEGDNKKIIKKYLESWIKLLSPITPHFAEELWLILSRKNFISLEKWPVADEKKIDENLEKQEEQIENTIKDILYIKNLLKENRPYTYIYTIPNEQKLFNENKNFLANMTGSEVIGIFSTKDIKENPALDPECKAKKAKPGKPGIYISGTTLNM